MPSASTPPSSMWEHTSDSSEATECDDLELDFNPMHPSQAGLFRRLIGTWSLERAVASSSSTGIQVSDPLGSAPRGLLIYSPDGYVTASLEASPDALPSAPSTILYTGPFELTAPNKAEAYDGRYPDALCFDMLDSSIHADDIGKILVRELKIGHGPHRKLAMHMADAILAGPDHTPLSLDLQWKREEAFSF